MRQREYEYQRLPGPGYIRLLEFVKNTTEPLTGRLRSFHLDSAPKYHALSYTWGSRKRNVSISIDGDEIRVNQSLAAGLKELVRLSSGGIAAGSGDSRSEDTEQSSGQDAFDASEIRYIWIDQVCINQNDLDERGHQVQQMNTIYGSSERTIVWLGQDHGFAETGIRVLQQIENLYLDQFPEVEGQRRFMPFKGRGTFDVHDHLTIGLPPASSRKWKAMIRLLSMPWFRRVWIVQEVVLSRQDPLVICGNVRFSWSMLAWASHWLYRRGYIGTEIVAAGAPQAIACIHMLLHMRVNGVQYDMAALALLGTRFFSTDPRDSIYGVLALESAGSHPDGSSSSSKIKPNYKLPVPEAHCNAVHQIIISSRSLAILGLPVGRLPGSWDPLRCFGRQVFWKDRPSWVPHFEDIPQGRLFTNFYIAEPSDGLFSLSYPLIEKFSAAKQMPARLVDSGMGVKTLGLKGLCFDRVKLSLRTVSMPALSRQNGLNRSSRLHGISRGALYHMSDRRHWGRIRTFLYILHNEVVGLQRPSVLDIWEAALTHSRYKSPLEIATAVLEATTAGMDATYSSWSDQGLSDFCSFVVDLYKRWPQRKLSSRLDDARQAIGKYIEDRPGNGRNYAASMRFWSGMRPFFITEQGYLGIGPSSMKKGDEVCVLFGGGLPYIIRRTQDHCQFIGDSYVHELGQGQAIDAWQRGELKEEVFHMQ